MLIACLQVSAETAGQLVTLNAQEPIASNAYFHNIKKQSGVRFIYGKELISKAMPVNIHVKDMPLTHALELVFEGQPLNYRMAEKYIIISPRTVAMPATVNTTAEDPPGGSTWFDP